MPGFVFILCLAIPGENVMGKNEIQNRKADIMSETFDLESRDSVFKQVACIQKSM